jgi:hypothetical protein
MVSYTIVSRGRVLGTTEFEYRRWREGIRGGSFVPAADAAHLVDIAVGVSPAAITLGKKFREMDRQRDQALSTGAWRSPHHRATTEHADLASACDHEGALELELRGPDGALIETDWIALQDTEFLLSLNDDDLAETECCDDWSDDGLELSAAGISGLDDDEVFGEMFDETDDEGEPWSDDCDLEWTDEVEKPFPRYQIFVTLRDDDAVP